MGQPQSQSQSAFIGQGSELRDLVRELPWHETSLGAIDEWPASLKTTVSIVMNSQQPMFLFWGPELIQIYNDAYRPSFGEGKHPAALGQPAKLFWQEVWDVIEPMFDAVRAGDSTVLHENQLIPVWRNGRVEDCYWTYTYNAVYDETGTVAGVLAIVTETTGSVVSERRQSILSWLSVKLRRCTSREAVFQLLQRTAALHPVDLPGILVTDHAETAAPSLTLTANELGLDVKLELTFILNPTVPFEGYRAFLSDITSRVGTVLLEAEAEQARALAVADRDQLLMNAPVGTAVLIGEDLVYELANPLYLEMIDRDDIVGKSFDEVFPELIDQPIRATFQDAFRSGNSYSDNELNVQIYRGGELRNCYYEFNLTPLRHHGGGIYGLMVVVIEITEQVLARKETELLNEELQVASRSKDEFLAMLGHELRNPLSPIVNGIQLIEQKHDELPAEYQMIKRQVNHLVRLVDDLLDISRITRGLVELRFEQVRLPEVVERAVEMSKDLFERKGHRLSLDVPEISLVCDPARIAQVLSNLLTNAARYTQAAGNVRLSAQVKAEEVHIAVEDSGIGISPKLLPLIFDLFVQGKRSTDRAEGGLGLGLALVKNLVSLHGGRVSGESEGEGKGSIFRVVLPLKPGMPDETTSATSHQIITKATLHGRILLVDDNRDAVDSLAELLSMKGFNVKAVYHPYEALDVFSQGDFDVAILDIGLPGMDGYELMARLRHMKPGTSCRFIALSGYGQDKDKARSLSSGFSHHVVKPVLTEDLLAILRLSH
tara:strand:- start:108993 stop:111311 length:2319 start_codon:yes stop_codon:yes gene_type:complete